MNLLADATLPGVIEAFSPFFNITPYQYPQEIPRLLDNQDILLCRSTLQVTRSLLDNHRLRYVATASSGTDHIDTDYLQAKSIQLIDAKGANATAVADYVIATLAFLQKDNGFTGKTAGIIGVGAIGSEVLQRLRAKHMDVLCYDPPRQHRDPHFLSCSLDDLIRCDLLCIHANLHHTPPFPSLNLLNESFLQQLKPGCVIINASRGGIVNELALLKQRELIYCTDVYDNEPAINADIIEFATLCTPHIAGHSIEAKYAAVSVISQQLHRHYQLPVPLAITPPAPLAPKFSVGQSWQSKILSLFNPIEETKHLKQSLDLATTFISLRNLHQNRHDFSAYGYLENDKVISQ